MKRSNSESLFNQAQQSLVGGVNSPVRAYKAVGGTPVFIKQGSGAYVVCEDNHHYIDYVLSYGPLIFGHAYPKTLKAIETTMHNGTTFGAPTNLEIKLAEKIKAAYPYVDKVRFVSSGTEATMSAVRLARGVTKKSIIVKFEGCYHGHVDPLLVAAGSGSATLGISGSNGVLNEIAQNTAVLEYNNTDQVNTFFQKHHNDIACVIVEPVTGNMGVVLPTPEFMNTLRSQCNQTNTLLIFDEVMCGFRSQQTGTHEWIGVNPDIVILGKVIGGGLPCGAFAAKDTIMKHLAPEGDVYQAGTLSGNPLAMAAGLETLTNLENPKVFKSISDYTKELALALSTTIKKHNIPASIQFKGSMFTLFFNKNPINSFKDVQKCNTHMFKDFFNLMLNHHIFLPPSQYEACFVSFMHTDKELSKTIDTFNKIILDV